MVRRSKVDKQLDALAEIFTPRIKAAFLAAVADVKDTAIISSIVNAIQIGDLEAAFRATGLSAAAMRPVTQMIETAFEQGGVTVARSAPAKLVDNMGNRTVFRFDVRNSRSEAWLRDHSSALVTRISTETRTNIKTIIEQGVRDGRNPRNIALDIVGRINPDTGKRAGGIIGLTGPQEQWVKNARAELNDLDPHYFTRAARDKRFDSVVRTAIKDGKAIPSAKIDAIVDRYSDNLLLQRGETIARTEAIHSLNKAADDAFRQAIAEGTLPPKAVTKTWDSAGDNRVRDTHKSLDGKTVSLDDPFVSSDGAQLMFPGDTSLGAPGSEVINCRCRVRHTVDWDALLDDEDLPPIPAPAPPVPEVVPAPPMPAPRPPAPPMPSLADLLPPQETTAARNARLDIEQKNYVLENGVRDGVEYISNFDAVTGEVLGRSNGVKNFVAFTDELIAAISDAGREIVLHHNHPGSSSFSGQDLFMLHDYRGMKEIWAHGHNGSSYFANRGAKSAGLRPTWLDTQSRMSTKINAYIKANGTGGLSTEQITADMNLIFYHIVSLIMEKKGFINYRAELSGPTLAAAERQQAMIAAIVRDN